MKMHRRLEQAPTSYLDYEEALKIARIPQTVQSRVLRPLGMAYSGIEYYETDFIYGKAKINFAIKKDKKVMIQEVIRSWKSGIDEMDFLEEVGDKRFLLRRLENMAIKKRMQRYLTVIEPCSKKSDWHGCIYGGGLDLEY